MPGGLALLQTLFADVRTALMHGLQEIFFWSAVIMVAVDPAAPDAEARAAAHAGGVERRRQGGPGRGLAALMAI